LLDVWVKELEDGSIAIGFFNRSREPLPANIDLKDLGLMGRCLVRDLWRRADLGIAQKTISVNPRPHGVEFYRLSLVP
jgi:alpha-galactosidase